MQFLLTVSSFFSPPKASIFSVTCNDLGKNCIYYSTLINILVTKLNLFILFDYTFYTLDFRSSF